MTDIPIHLRKRHYHRVVVEVSYPGPIAEKLAVRMVESVLKEGPLPTHLRFESAKQYSRVVAREKGSVFSFVRSFFK